MDVRVGTLRDAWFPADFEAAKAQLIAAIDGFAADLVLAPALHDVHQDHRLLAELAWQVVRTPAIWSYEIPKFEGDLGQPNVFVWLSDGTARRKAELLVRCFPSQGGRAWFREETFLSLLRIRGLEAKAPEGYAEAFHVRKLVDLRRPMRILVTGHLGYIGTVLTPVLLRAGHEVVGLDSDLYGGCTFGAGRRRARCAGHPTRPARRDGRRPRGRRGGHPPRRAVERPAGRPGPGTDVCHQPPGVGAARGARPGRGRRTVPVLLLMLQLRGRRRP